VRRLVVTVVLLAGCDYVFRLDTLTARDGSSGDRGDGDAIVEGDGNNALCFGKNGAAGAGLARICVSMAPTNTFDPATIIVTDGVAPDGACTFMHPQPSGPDLCVIVARVIALDTAVRASGKYPLVLLATDTLTLTGSLSAASRLPPQLQGPGSPYGGCPLLLAGSNNANKGAGGGAGGSFGLLGGMGGGGDGGAASGAAPASVPAPTIVYGGCDGSTGGTGNGATGGAGGPGGGAVYLIAGTTIAIDGFVNASGAGGGPGSAPLGGAGALGGGGGGAGGSGGLIGLDAPTIAFTSNAKLVANGGGGGGGGGTITAGAAGNDPALAMVAASGGLGGNTGGGAGGDGFAGMSPVQSGTTATSGGGGGGGGAGVIKVYTMTLTGMPVASPAFQTN
jgi:hypothetical protein